MLVRTRPYRPSVAFRTFDRSFDRAFEQLTSSFFTTAPRTPVVDASWQRRRPRAHRRPPRRGRRAGRRGGLRPHADAVGARPSTPRGSAASRIGAALDPESVTAHHVDGRLTVTVAAAAKPEARTIEIATTAPAAIEAGEPSARGRPSGQPENGTSDNA